jgi:hypothetical protein
MATKSIEARLAEVEKKLEYATREAERARAATECLRLVSRYCYLHARGRDREWYLDSFAKKSPDIAVGHGQMGIMVGKKSLEKKIFARRRPEGEEGGPEGRIGWCFLHPTASPYIEVARDGKTARGMFLSIGIESAGDARGVLKPAWGWGAYGVDFIKEDGEWKIWHFAINRIFRGDYFSSWTTYDPDIEEGYYTVPPEKRYDKPPVDDSPYRPTQKFVLKPEPPEPYETFDPKHSYC